MSLELQSARSFPRYPTNVRRQTIAGTGARALGVIAPIVLGLAVTALPVLLHITSQTAAILSCVLLGLLVASFATRFVPVLLIVALSLQNLFVALVSPHIETLDQFNSIRAYTFLLTAVIWLLLFTSFLVGSRSCARDMRRLIWVTTAALVLIGGYFCLGLLSDPTGAAIYLRNIATPFMLLQIFALAAYRRRIEIIGPLQLIAAFLIVYGFAELFQQEALHRLVNGDTYITLNLRQSYEAGAWLRELQETGRVIRSYLDTLAIDPLNTPYFAEWGFKLNRLVGPNFHSISFAYCIAGLAVILSGTGRWWFTLLALPLVLVIGSKGALFLLAFATVTLLAVSYVPGMRRLWIFVGLLICYAVFGIKMGISTNDYHVIGFLGGVRGFLSNPIGHGIGVGGNLSVNMAEMVDWSRSQGLGHTDIAVESAVGVLLYQVGIGGLLLLGVLTWIGVRLWGLYRVSFDPVYAAAGIAMLTILANGIFQEEALFAPLALGLLAALSGLLLGSRYGDQAASEHRGVAQGVIGLHVRGHAFPVRRTLWRSN